MDIFRKEYQIAFDVFSVLSKDAFKKSNEIQYDLNKLYYSQNPVTTPVLRKILTELAAHKLISSKRGWGFKSLRSQINYYDVAYVLGFKFSKVDISKPSPSGKIVKKAFDLFTSLVYHTSTKELL